MIDSFLAGEDWEEPPAGMAFESTYGSILEETSELVAGSIVGSGTVSNQEAGGPGRPAAAGGVGYSCIAEQRTVETLGGGKPVTPFLRFGDRVRIEMTDRAGRSIFGAIDQVVRAPA